MKHRVDKKALLQIHFVCYLWACAVLWHYDNVLAGLVEWN